MKFEGNQFHLLKLMRQRKLFIVLNKEYKNVADTISNKEIKSSNISIIKSKFKILIRRLLECTSDIY